MKRRTLRMNASFDAAEANRLLDNYWAQARDESANNAASPEKRRKLRTRARYEVANNSVAKGIVLTLTNDVVGSGPRMQLTSDNPDHADALRFAERAWREWCEAVGLVEKIRALFSAKIVDGEGVSFFAAGRVAGSPVPLDLVTVEADRLTSPDTGVGRANGDIDGVFVDEYGRPTKYSIARKHPSDFAITPAGAAFRTLDPDRVIHLFRQDRPEQTRGVPYLTPCLNLFALLRRYTLATVTSAETAAAIAMVITSDATAGGFGDEIEDVESDVELSPGDNVPIGNGMAMTLPSGYSIEQVKAEQPASGFEEFRRALIVEIARCLNMPANVALGDSSRYNYASGRLDHQTYHGQIGIEREHLERVVLSRVYREWFAAALSSVAALPASVRAILTGDTSIDVRWLWPAREHVDPVKEANAAAIRIENGLTTRSVELARAGLDFRETTVRQAEERDYRAEHGLDVEPVVVVDGDPFGDFDDAEEDEADEI